MLTLSGVGPTIYPPPLKHGDTIALAAFGTSTTLCHPELIVRCLKRLEQRGLKIKPSNLGVRTYGDRAGSAKERAEVLHGLFEDPQVKGILSFWAGHASIEILEHLDAKVIQKHPKVFIGYSDTTCLQLAIHQLTGLTTFTGPAGITFSKPILPKETWQSFEDLVMHAKHTVTLLPARAYSDHPWYFGDPKKARMHFKKTSGWKVLQDGSATGRILGGNLASLMSLAGTPYWPNLDQSILYIECAEDQSIKDFEQHLYQLKYSQSYRTLSGLLVGRFPSNLGVSSKQIQRMITSSFDGYISGPIVTHFDCGHTDPVFTIPFGYPVTLRTNPCSLTICPPRRSNH